MIAIDSTIEHIIAGTYHSTNCSVTPAIDMLSMHLSFQLSIQHQAPARPYASLTNGIHKNRRINALITYQSLE